ncbi:uncharacterized protein [Nicotiana tomentosiformis]|uniref:uncharacterized protein n=1 Tax=Nicotiana tomentosiformis TaxID=4098 RepID=UPI00388C88D7
MITAPVAAPAVRSPRGGGQVGRGRPRGGGQAGRGHPGGTPARFYAFSARPDAVASDAVITSIISICGRDASVLFDPGSTYSYVSYLFAHFMDTPRESLGTTVYVSTPVGDSVVVDQIYRSCVITFCGYETRADLLFLDMTDFEVILGMDWLSPYHAILDCHARTVTLAMPKLPRLEWKGLSVSTSSQIIFIVFIDDILIYSCSMEDHEHHLRVVDIVAFLGHVVSGEGIKVDPKKIEAVQSCPRLTSATEIRSFLGLSGYYRRFVEGFSSIIKAGQFDDPHLLVLRETILQGSTKEVSIGEDGVLRLQGRICVPNVDGLRERILEEAHSSRYSIYPGTTKMYCDLKQHYWRRRMKRDIIEYVARCLNCQQVKYEHQRPGGLLQQMTILEWKWERITMDFVVGLP